MSFWTSQRLIRELHGQRSPVINGQEGRVKCACYELALGGEAFITSEGTKRPFQRGEQIRLPAGQFAMLITEEALKLPPDLLGFISIRASMKMSGLVNVSGFHVDPGFEGRLKFSVYNAGSEPIVLDVGEPLFPIWFFELSEADSKPYDGAHKGQKTISGEDVAKLQGEVASPAALQEELRALRALVQSYKESVSMIITVTVAIAAVVATIIAIAK